MIAGALVVALLVGRELARAGRPNSSLVRALTRMLIPAGCGLAVVMAVRLVELVAGGA